MHLEPTLHDIARGFAEVGAPELIVSLLIPSPKTPDASSHRTRAFSAETSILLLKSAPGSPLPTAAEPHNCKASLVQICFPSLNAYRDYFVVCEMNRK